jgi:hypothetical protein
MGARSLQQTCTYTNREPVNGVVLEVCEGDWKSISEGEINLVGSCSRFLRRTMRIHMLTCENVKVGLKELMTRYFTWGDQFLGRAKISRMLPCDDVSVGLKEVTTQSFTCVVTKVVVVRRGLG